MFNPYGLGILLVFKAMEPIGCSDKEGERLYSWN